jgi:hypothetical protein
LNSRLVAYLAALSLLVSLIAVSTATPATAASGVTRLIALAGTGSPITGAFVQSPDGLGHPEFSAEDAPTLPSFNGIITPSTTRGEGSGGETSNPQLKGGFEGLNLFQQRFARGGNQFTVEPPDQGLCVGNGYIVEAVNDVFNVYNSSGVSQLPANNVGGAVDLNSLYNYPPAINRTTGVRGPFLTDPSCLYDSQVKRFFIVVLTLDTRPNGAFTLVNHLDLAVSTTSNPTGTWRIYKVDVTNDGSNPAPQNACPCLGDYPHIGADANGFYITTNAYPWTAVSSEFAGAQIYAFSKRQLAAGAASVPVTHIDTWASVDVMTQETPSIKQPGFTVWPSVSAQVSDEVGQNGTEFFLSSNAADEATHPIAGIGGNYTSNKIIAWSLSNTRSLDRGTPSLDLTNKVLQVNTYAIPDRAAQPGSGNPPGNGTPQGKCINDTTTLLFDGTTRGCWKLLFGSEPAHNEVVSRLDSNDTRMQQVMYADGKLWGALGTAVTVGGSNKAGIAYFIVNVGDKNDNQRDLASNRENDGNRGLKASIALQGTYGVAGKNLIYPAVGVTAQGKGVVAFTLTSATDFPSAAYASIDAVNGIGAVQIAAAGLATDDGFTSYKAQVGNPPRTRWGDYGSAAVDGNSIWIASEYIAHACSYTQWGGNAFAGGTGAFGICGGTRAALGNWSTRISKVTP